MDIEAQRRMKKYKVKFLQVVDGEDWESGDGHASLRRRPVLASIDYCGPVRTSTAASCRDHARLQSLEVPCLLRKREVDLSRLGSLAGRPRHR